MSSRPRRLVDSEQHGFITNFVAQLPYASNADRFAMLVLTVDSQEELGDETRQNLDHHLVLASGKRLVNFEEPFPPGDEFFNLPAELIGKGDLFCC